MPFMYILECDNGTYYTGSTINLDCRMAEHASGNGANYTRKHKPIRLAYLEEYLRIEDAFLREKQIQPWSQKKKLALMSGDIEKIHELAMCRNLSHHFLK
jgi:putative endonuclease